MINFVAAIHIFGAVGLIALVLLQDCKDGAIGGMMGGGGSNSLLGATGATTLLEKLTRGFAIFFAGTCILLTVLSAENGSVTDDLSAVPAAAAPTTPGAASPGAQEPNAAAASSAAAPAATAPATGNGPAAPAGAQAPEANPAK